MNWGLFESFCEMLEGIPIKAVLRAADAERRMVEEDLKKHRAEPNECVNSVLGFCNFLKLAVRGIYALPAALPLEHRLFYGRIVQQLVDAGELPAEIKGHLEEIFSTSADKTEASESSERGRYPTRPQFA
jgi:hypothetical protein